MLIDTSRYALRWVLTELCKGLFGMKSGPHVVHNLCFINVFSLKAYKIKTVNLDIVLMDKR